MTDGFNKATQKSLSEKQELAFYAVMSNALPGAKAVKDLCNQCFDGNALAHTWMLPDGHWSHVPVTDVVDAKIEIDELNHASFTYRTEVNVPNPGKWRGLAPNVVHSTDSFVVREMVRRLDKLGIAVLPNHDSFGSHLNHMNEVRATYRDILAEIASSTLLEDILNQLGLDKTLYKLSDNLADYIYDAEYMLS